MTLSSLQRGEGGEFPLNILEPVYDLLAEKIFITKRDTLLKLCHAKLAGLKTVCNFYGSSFETALIFRKDSYMATKTITIYTDGGSRNTGNRKGGHVNSTDKAAWAFLILHEEKEYTKSAGVFGATNNQMELTAILEALREIYRKKLMNKNIILISDSKYAIDSINKGWLASWAKNNWRNSTKKK